MRSGNPLTVLCIRHAEKPELGGADGVDTSGRPDPRSLTPRGWQRAGAWIQLFQPALSGTPPLPLPKAIFASSSGKDDDRSRRPVETVTPLAAMLSVGIDQRFGKGQEGALAAAIQEQAGVVLVCWQHEDMIAITQALDDPPAGVPPHWPSHCFNAVYRLEWSGSGWSFSMSMPRLLDGDPEVPFS